MNLWIAAQVPSLWLPPCRPAEVVTGALVCRMLRVIMVPAEYFVGKLASPLSLRLKPRLIGGLAAPAAH